MSLARAKSGDTLSRPRAERRQVTLVMDYTQRLEALTIRLAIARDVDWYALTALEKHRWFQQVKAEAGAVDAPLHAADLLDASWR